jgi:hypothetical protein
MDEQTLSPNHRTAVDNGAVAAVTLKRAMYDLCATLLRPETLGTVPHKHSFYPRLEMEEQVSLA